MNKTLHNIYLWSLTIVVIVITGFIGYYGYDYYSTPLEERFYNDYHDWFKPSGIFGQGLGILGTLLILFGVVLYIVAKKYGIFDRFVRLKYILEFHIFLCTLGPILILFHTAFKFGGIVSIAFWSMVAVVLSGVVGRYIYIQIPRSKEGRELSLSELANAQKQLVDQLNHVTINANQVQEVATNKTLYSKLGLVATIKRKIKLRSFLNQWHADGVPQGELAGIKTMIQQQWTIRRRIEHMDQMQRIFKYWHIVHRPFALIMLIIVIIHISLTVALGYTWIW